MGVVNRKRRGVNEIIPGKLYQRGQFLGWTHEQKHDLLHELGVDVVVNLWHKIDADLSRDIEGVWYINAVCSPTGIPADGDVLLATLALLITRGHCVLIHCEAGRGRSAWLSARVAARLLGLHGEDIVDFIRNRIPNQEISPILLADLRAH